MNSKLNFIVTEGAALNENINFIEALRAGEKSGIIIKNFLTAETNALMLKNFLATDYFYKADLPNNQGFVYPKTIYAYQKIDNSNEKNFFEYCENFNLNFENNFGFDFYKDFKAFMYKMGILSLQHLPSPAYSYHYPFATFRYLNAGFGEMTPHCENSLHVFAPDFVNHTQHFLNHQTCFSFFVLLKKPSFGGDFLIYDLTWDDTRHINNEGLYIDKFGNANNIKDVEAYSAPLDEGDLILFNGGQLWHTTKMVYGDFPRITFGGFLGFDNNLNHVFLWS